MPLSPQAFLAAGLVGLLFLRKGRNVKPDTVKAASRWLGKTEQDPEVVDLVADYVTAWQWAVPPGPGEIPDWCAIVAMEWIREGGGFEPWPIDVYRAPIPGFPWQYWIGDVGDLIQMGMNSPRITEVRTPSPGDLYTQGTTHAGVVATVEGSAMTTIDGNWSNAVGTRRTSLAGKRFWSWA